MLLSAVVQGLLASVGYYFVGIDRVFFLTALTMFLAMVPFIGSAAVWVSCLRLGLPLPAVGYTGGLTGLVLHGGCLHGRQCDQTDGAAWLVEFVFPVGIVEARAGGAAYWARLGFSRV